MNEPDLEFIIFTPKDVAEILDITTRKVRRLCQTGQLIYSKIGPLYRFQATDLKEFIEKNTPEAESRFREAVQYRLAKILGSADE